MIVLFRCDRIYTYTIEPPPMSTQCPLIIVHATPSAWPPSRPCWPGLGISCYNVSCSLAERDYRRVAHWMKFSSSELAALIGGDLAATAALLPPPRAKYEPPKRAPRTPMASYWKSLSVNWSQSTTTARIPKHDAMAQARMVTNVVRADLAAKNAVCLNHLGGLGRLASKKLVRGRGCAGMGLTFGYGEVVDASKLLS